MTDTLRNFIISTVITVAVIAVLTVIRIVVKKIVIKVYAKKAGASGSPAKYKHIQKLAIGASNLIYWIIVVVVVLDYTGMSSVITAIITFAGVGSLVIGLAAQDIFKDVIAGFILITEGNLSYDDYVEIDGKEGTVEEIKLRNIYLRTYSGQLIAIPSGEVHTIVNYSRGNAKAMVHVNVSAYEDVDRVREAIRSAGHRLKEDDSAALSDVFIDGITSIDDKSYNVRAYLIVDGADYFRMQRRFNEYIIGELRERKINFTAENRVLVGAIGGRNEDQGESDMTVSLGNIVTTKKPHPCGCNEFKVVRTGADYKLKCLKCGRVVMFDADKLGKSVKKIKEEGDGGI